MRRAAAACLALLAAPAAACDLPELADLAGDWTIVPGALRVSLDGADVTPNEIVPESGARFAADGDGLEATLTLLGDTMEPSPVTATTGEAIDLELVASGGLGDVPGLVTAEEVLAQSGCAPGEQTVFLVDGAFTVALAPVSRNVMLGSVLLGFEAGAPTAGLTMQHLVRLER